MNFGCSFCKSTGHIVAESRKNRSLFAFSCTCSLGSAHRNLPQWNSKHSIKFKPDWETTPPMDPKEKAANDDTKKQDQGAGSENAKILNPESFDPPW